MQQLFVSHADARVSRIHPACISIVVHAAILAMAYSPSTAAHLATPRAAVEDIRFMSLMVGATSGYHLGGARRVRRSAKRRPIERGIPAPPRLDVLNLTLALNLAPMPQFFLERELPQLPDLAADIAAEFAGVSSVSRGPSRSTANTPNELPGGADSVTYDASAVDVNAVPDVVNPKPRYPSRLLVRSMEATFAVNYVVDTSGHVDPTTIQAPATAHPEFVDAVRHALLEWRFAPAKVRGHRVRQLVVQTFTFTIAGGRTG